MNYTKENFIENGERCPRKIVQHILQEPNKGEEVIEFVMDELEFEDKLKDLEEKHKHEKKELYHEYGREFKS